MVIPEENNDIIFSRIDSNITIIYKSLFSYHFQQKFHFKSFMHYTQHLLNNTQRYIRDATIWGNTVLHIAFECIAIYCCIAIFDIMSAFSSKN